MARIRQTKTNFTAGEVSQALIGRSDLTAYENGAARLRNVFIRPTGSVHRRPGLRHVADAPGCGRLVAFEFNVDQVFLLLFYDYQLRVFDGAAWQEPITAPWSEAQVRQITWTQSADTLLVVHPDVPPKKITRTLNNSMRIDDWEFFAEPIGRLQMPHYKFAGLDVTLSRSGAGDSVVLTASSHVFHPDHQNIRFRFEDKELIISEVAGAGGSEMNGWYDMATATAVEDLTGTALQTRDWSEQAFSPVRGWPVALTFHQDRLVIGGSRDLPNRLWLSKSADLFNFDQGEGQDDEAIEFALLSDQVNALRAVFSGRHLQVFTSGAEWMVTGDPLTPTNIQVNRQTRIGSLTDRTIPPRDVDGATVFVPRNGRQIREYLFTDVEQAYRATDLALLAAHIVNDPVDMDYDPANRLLHVVMANGTLGTVTLYRVEQVTAWSVQETAGLFKSIAVVGDTVYLLVDRDGVLSIEAFDESLNVDAGLTGSSAEPTVLWSNLHHLEGRIVKVLADDMPRLDTGIAGGEIVLDEPASAVQVGLGYSHVIEPLPHSARIGGGSAEGVRIRPISVTFRLHETRSLIVDVGEGLQAVPFATFGPDLLDSQGEPFTGDKTVRLMGWRRSAIDGGWRIVQDVPLPFALLSVTSEYSING